ncbi:MAG TPA: hypothetical protein VHM29_01585 [Acidimicrobiia bacterium]|jgi:hypothetical protein|nr:hypothetical protein [Acidimicrobiia bacterium]
MQAPGSPDEDRSGGFEYGLMIHPLLLGGGKLLFDQESAMRPLRLVDSKTSTTGVILATYRPEDR